MNSNKRDIYFNGEIIVDFTGFNPNKNTVSKNKSYPVQGSHSFKDGEDVTGRYELERRGTTSKFFDKTFAIPTPAPVSEQEKSFMDAIPDIVAKNLADNSLPKEVEGKAKELHHKFYRVDMMNEDLLHMDWEQAKQCALISNQREIDLINRLLTTGLNNDFDLLRERGELMDVRTAINQL